MTENLKLPDKDFKVAITKLLKRTITYTLETNEKIEHLSKEIAIKKKNQMQIK